MLLDSNIIIYSVMPQYAGLRVLIAQHAPAVSAISLVEVLGYHRLSAAARQDFEGFFASAIVLPVSRDVLDEAVQLRQRRKMTLGDALIAATAVVHSLTLLTHNPSDFAWIPGLQVVDPLQP
jgi:predicted nucleic acid-binding protein